ncbi:hypothetical protein JCM8097_008071 [Rhodosporidiobolus ruineniae]
MSDRLTSLPTELLDRVCDYVCYPRVPAALALVCRAFVPSVRSRRFKDVHICNSPSLKKLCELFDVTPAAAAHVNTLKIAREWSDRHHSTVADFDSRVVQLFQRMTRVHTLEITRTRRYADLLVSAPLDPPLLPSLEILSLTNCFDSWTTPFDLERLRGLERFPELYHLELRTSPRPTPAPAPQQQPTGAIKQRWLWDVYLEGSLTGETGASELIAALPSLRTLSLLDNSDGEQDPGDLLSQVQFPHLLEELGLNCNLEPTSTRLAALLPTFVNLKVLAANNLFGPSFLPVLSLLPSLRELKLYPGCDVTAEEVCGLFNGPNACSALESLLLGVSDLEQDEWERIVDLAEARHVELKGKAVERARRSRQERLGLAV